MKDIGVPYLMKIKLEKYVVSAIKYIRGIAFAKKLK